MTSRLWVQLIHLVQATDSMVSLEIGKWLVAGTCQLLSGLLGMIIARILAGWGHEINYTTAAPTGHTLIPTKLVARIVKETSL